MLKIQKSMNFIFNQILIRTKKDDKRSCPTIYFNIRDQKVNLIKEFSYIDH